MAYSVINAIVGQCDPSLTAAEAHGMATGMLCAQSGTHSDYWLTQLLQDTTGLSIEQNTLLVRLFEETRRLLGSDEFDFNLLLPDEESPLAEQIQALCNWCHGFLFGVGSVGLNVNLSKEAREILKDISEFTKIDAEADGEENEFAFMEITEYLKSAVLLLQEELNSSADSLS